MTSYDPYDTPRGERERERERDRDRPRYYYEDRHSARDAKYAESRQYAESRNGRLAPEPSSRDLVMRPREDSDLSVEEIRREDFPGYYTRDIRRAQSAEPVYYENDRGYARAYATEVYEPYYADRSLAKRATSVYYEEEERKKARVLSKQQQIMAAITGAALTLGGKELYDRKQAKQQGTEVHRDLLTAAALGAAGAFAGYQGSEIYNRRKDRDEKESKYVLTKDRHGHVHEYYNEDEVDADSKEGKAHHNFLTKALTAAGLGSAVKALTGGGHNDDRSETASVRSTRSTRSRRSYRSTSRTSRSRRDSRSRSRSRGHRNHDPSKRIQQAAKASLLAGAAEAFRVSKEPGAWQGEKIKRVLTAAAGAATIDAAHDPNKGHNKLTLLESVIGGLVGNRVINGSRKDIEEDEKGRSRSRSRARSQSRGGNAALAAIGAALAGAGVNRAYKDRKASRSRSRRDELDSPEMSPDRKRRTRSRSRSVVDSARRQLAKIGIGHGPDGDNDTRDRRNRSRSRSLHDSDGDDLDDRDRKPRRGGGRRSNADDRRRSPDDADLGLSDDDERRTRRMRGKQVLTGALAGVATIHAVHDVYLSMERRNTREKALREGKITKDEAQKLKTRAILQDAAAIGIAALGIHSAISELKETRHLTHEMKEWREVKEERHRLRTERQRRLQLNGEGGSDGSRPRSVGGSDRGGINQDGARHRGRANNWYSPTPASTVRREDGTRLGDSAAHSDGQPYNTAYPGERNDLPRR